MQATTFNYTAAPVSMRRVRLGLSGIRLSNIGFWWRSTRDPKIANLTTGQSELASAAFVALTLHSIGRLPTGHARKYPQHHRNGAGVAARLMEPHLTRAFKGALKRACPDRIEAGFALAFRGSQEVRNAALATTTDS